jgi:hypothetical protein
LTAPDRLTLLLPWLNDEYGTDVYGPTTRPEDVQTWTDYAKVRRALADFVRSFDGSSGAGYLEVVEPGKLPLLMDEDLDRLAAALRLLLGAGFEDATLTDRTLQVALLDIGLGDATRADLSLPAASLRVWVRGAGRHPPKRIFGKRVGEGGIQAQRAYRAAGAYVLQVQGDPADLAPFLVAHLLTQADMVAVRRCERTGCDHYVLVAMAKRGARQRFCSATCRVWNAELKQRKNKR